MKIYLRCLRALFAVVLLGGMLGACVYTPPEETSEAMRHMPTHKPPHAGMMQEMQDPMARYTPTPALPAPMPAAQPEMKAPACCCGMQGGCEGCQKGGCGCMRDGKPMRGKQPGMCNPQMMRGMTPPPPPVALPPR